MIYFYQQISKNHIGDVLVSVLDASNKVDRGFNDGEAVSGRWLSPGTTVCFLH